jgi:hypothetical protein
MRRLYTAGTESSEGEGGDDRFVDGAGVGEDGVEEV